MIEVSPYPYLQKYEPTIGKIGVFPPENMMTNLERSLVVALAANAELSTPGRPKVEIGTYEGYTTYVLAKAFPHCKILTVDLYPEVAHKEQPGEFLGHHYKSGQCGNVIQSLRSQNCLNEEFWRTILEDVPNFWLIDGDHSYESVKADLADAQDGIAIKDGIIALDDCNQPRCRESYREVPLYLLPL